MTTGSFAVEALTLYRNLRTAGTLTPIAFGPEVLFNVGNRVKNVALGDLGGEGKPAVALVTDMHNLTLYRNLSMPDSLTKTSLGTPITLRCATNAVAVAVAIRDLDGDGRPDLVVANTYDCRLSLFHNVNPLQRGGPQSTTGTAIWTNGFVSDVTRNPLAPGH